jgi:hypothetical protein
MVEQLVERHHRAGALEPGRQATSPKWSSNESRRLSRLAETAI